MVSLSQCHSIIQCVAQCVIQKCTVESVLCLHVCTSLVTMQSQQHVKSLSSWSLPGTAFGLACTLPQAWNAVLSIGGEKTLSRSCVILWKTLSLTSFFLSRNKGNTDISVIWVWIFEARHFVAEFVSHWFVIIYVFVCVCAVWERLSWSLRKNILPLGTIHRRFWYSWFCQIAMTWHSENGTVTELPKLSAAVSHISGSSQLPSRSSERPAVSCR